MRLLVLIALLIAVGSCSRKPEATQPERHYALSGKITALNAKSQTATVDGAAIPNFMEAMTMEYPVKSKVDFDTLHVGDVIKATVNVSDSGGYNLSNIQKQIPGR